MCIRGLPWCQIIAGERSPAREVASGAAFDGDGDSPPDHQHRVRLLAKRTRYVLQGLADVLPDPGVWQALAAVGWLVALSPWAMRIGHIYLTPRRDGRPG